MFTRDLFSNNARLELTVDAAATDVILDVGDAAAIATFAAPGAFGLKDDGYQRVQRATITNPSNASDREIVLIESISPGAGTIRVVRGVEGTIARDWPTGSVLEARVTAGMLEAITARAEPLEFDPIPSEGLYPPRPNKTGRVITGRTPILSFGVVPVWGASHAKGTVVYHNKSGRAVRFLFLDPWSGTPPTTTIISSSDLGYGMRFFRVPGANGPVRVLAYGVETFSVGSDNIHVSLPGDIFLLEYGVIFTRGGRVDDGIEIFFENEMIATPSYIIGTSHVTAPGYVCTFDASPPSADGSRQGAAVRSFTASVSGPTDMEVEGYIFWTGIPVPGDQVVDYSTAGPFIEVT